MLKDIRPEYSLERLMLKLQYFGQLLWEANSLEKTLMLGKIKGRREGWDRGWDGWMATTSSMDMSLCELQEIEKHREFCCMGSQRFGHNLATEQQ